MILTHSEIHSSLSLLHLESSLILIIIALKKVETLTSCDLPNFTLSHNFFLFFFFFNFFFTLFSKFSTFQSFLSPRQQQPPVSPSPSFLFPFFFFFFSIPHPLHFFFFFLSIFFFSTWTHLFFCSQKWVFAIPSRKTNQTKMKEREQMSFKKKKYIYIFYYYYYFLNRSHGSCQVTLEIYCVVFVSGAPTH